jgi:hypothetical protein
MQVLLKRQSRSGTRSSVTGQSVGDGCPNSAFLEVVLTLMGLWSVVDRRISQPARLQAVSGWMCDGEQPGQVGVGGNEIVAVGDIDPAMNGIGVNGRSGLNAVVDAGPESQRATEGDQQGQGPSGGQRLRRQRLTPMNGR